MIERYSAAEAREAATAFVDREWKEREKQCDEALERIYHDIEEKASEGARTISYSWDYSKGSVDLFFFGFTQNLWCWDGGEGRGDYPTDAGRYIVSDLENQDYEVHLSCGSLVIKW